MKAGEFVISVEFGDDSGKVTLGAEDTLYVEPAEGNKSVELTTEKLELLRLLQQAERTAVE